MCPIKTAAILLFRYDAARKAIDCNGFFLLPSMAAMVFSYIVILIVSASGRAAMAIPFLIWWFICKVFQGIFR